jgi:hypothetical protein
MKAPSADELAAIAAALAAYEGSAVHGRSRGEERRSATGAWTLAMRRPELEFEELLALRHACSTRF